LLLAKAYSDLIHPDKYSIKKKKKKKKAGKKKWKSQFYGSAYLLNNSKFI